MFAKLPSPRCAASFAVIVLVAATALTAWGAQAAPCDPAVDYATPAMTAYDASDYEAALPDLYCATGLDPQNIDLQAAYFQALLRAGHITSAAAPGAVLGSLEPGRFDQIVADAEAALSEDPTDTGALIILLSSRFDAQKEEREQLLALAPDSAIAYAYLAGKLAYFEGDPEAARTAIERAVELAADNPEVLSYASNIYFYGIGEPDNALALIEQAIAADPNFAPIYANRANYYANAGDLDTALESISRAIELNPYDYTNYNQRAFFYMEQENYPGALEDFRYVLSVNPASPAALGSITEISLITGNADDRALAVSSFLSARTEIATGETLSSEGPVIVPMTAGRMVSIPVMLEAGQTVTVSAAAADPDSLDPLLMVVDADGGAVAYNDDVNAEGGDYSAVVTFTPALSGEYVILATHSGAGTEGEMTVTLEAATS